MPKVKTRMLEAVSKMRHQLTSNNDTEINIDSFYEDEDFKRSIDRDEMKKVLEEYDLKIEFKIQKSKKQYEE